MLFDASVKSILVLALAAGLSLALRRSSAAFRHLIWLLAVASCLCLPVIFVTLPGWRLPVVVPQMLPLTEATPGLEGNLDVSQLPSLERRVETPRQPTSQIDPNPETARLPNTVQEASINSALPLQEAGWWAMPTLWACIGIAWGIGILIVLAPLLTGLVGIWRIARRSQRVTDGPLATLVSELVQQLGLKRRVTLLRSEAEMLLTWGIIRPQVLIPTDAENWSPDQQRAVLLHELAHVQRWDWLTQMLAHILCAIYWFNPLVWVADRQMHLERERACDDHVLTAGCRATDYAEHLLEIARTSRPSTFAACAAVAMAQPSWIEKRLRVILAPDRNRQPVTKVAVTVSILTVACLVLLIGIMRLAEAVDDLKEYAPYSFATANGRTGRAFSLITLITARAYLGTRDGQITQALEHVHTLEIGKAGNISSFQIRKLDRSPLSDAYVHYDGKLLGFCVDEEVVYKEDITHNAPGPKYNVVPIDQIQASLERMGLTKK